MSDDNIDDLQKQRIKRVDKVIQKVTDGYSNEMNKMNLVKLYNRQYTLRDVIVNGDNEITIGNAKLQLEEIEKSISELEAIVDWNQEYDTSVDEEAAKKFIKDNDLLLDGGEEFEYMVSQNEALDKLEQDLNNKIANDKKKLYSISKDDSDQS